MKRTAKAAITALFASLVIASGAFAADNTVVTVGSTQLTDSEVLQIIANSAGGNPMMAGMMLTQATLKDREELVNQIADALVFAEAGRKEGLASRADVAFKIKWQTAQILVEAYMQEMGKKFDTSEKAMKTYYDGHKSEFVQAEGAHVRHILCNTEADAMNAILDIYRTKDFAKVAADKSRDQNNAASGGDLGWVEKGMLDADVEAAIAKAELKTLTGPVKSAFGWHVIEVLERRASKQLSFDEAKDEVGQRMQRAFIDGQLKEARERIKVTVDQKSLENLGGIPAAAAEK